MAAFDGRERPFVAVRPFVAALAVVLAPSCALDDDRTLHPVEPSGGAGAGGDEAVTSSGRGGAAATNEGAASDTGGTSNNAGGPSTSTTTGTLLTGSCPDLNENQVPDCDETLVGNATFDAGTEDWEAETSAAIPWEESDAESPDREHVSGALVVTHAGAGAADQLSMAGSFQCIPVQGSASYRFLAQSFVLEAHEARGAAISALFYGSSDCSGNSLSVLNSAVQASAGGWRVLHTGGGAPELARSARVRLVAIKAETDAAVEVRFDNVLVIRE